MGLHGFTRALRRVLRRNTGVILTYHSVVGMSLPFDLWTHMPLDLFESHMAVLAREARVLPLAALAEAARGGRLPPHAVAITFDDGFGNNYFRAFPVLQRYGLPATIFLSTGFIDRPQMLWPERLAFALVRTDKRELVALGQCLPLTDARDRRQAYQLLRDDLKRHEPQVLLEMLAEYEKALDVGMRPEDPLHQEWRPLTWEEVRSMAASGLVSFGGHTVDHHILSRLDDADAEVQIAACAATLTDALGRPSDLWAYPNGTAADFAPRHRTMLERHGFCTIASAIPGYVTAGADTGCLRRWGLGSQQNIEGLRDILAKIPRG